MIHNYNNEKPKIHETSFVAPGAQLVGKITLKENTSIWYNCSLRADLNEINLGEGSNIQENSALHVDTNEPLNIGKFVTIGHSATIHGCTIKDNCLIGMGAILLNGSIINSNSIVAAGSLVTENKEFPPNSLIMGSPAKVVRKLSENEIQQIRESSKHYVELANNHKKSLKY